MSTSQDAVFELRNLENERTRGRKVSQFIEIPKKGGEVEAGESAIPLKIKPKVRPWQLKNVYKVVDKQDITSDDDDEDALIFAPQPFETITNIGYSDLLTHLTTKDLARRSDIIVSSTLSITFTPQAEFRYVPQKLAHITLEDAKEWVDKRATFRADSVVTAKLPEEGRSSAGSLTSSGGESSAVGPSQSPTLSGKSPNATGSEWRSHNNLAEKRRGGFHQANSSVAGLLAEQTVEK